MLHRPMDKKEAGILKKKVNNAGFRTEIAKHKGNYVVLVTGSR